MKSHNFFEHLIYLNDAECCRKTEFLRVIIPVLKSPNGHLGFSDVDLGRKTEHRLCTLGFYLHLCFLQAITKDTRIGHLD